jgi:uncharacterized membrane protein YraQ (UPF0718 family)
VKTNWKIEWKPLALIAGLFLACFYLPVGAGRFDNAVTEAFELVKWYAQEHVILCLIPAFFIAGAIGVFVSQASVMKYLGPKANKALAYGVASVSGTILAVCSCTVLPLFAGIWRMGAGLGPATAFLYSGPAINVLAIVLTARILGLELGIARAVGAIVFSIVIGLAMHFIYRKEEHAKAEAAAQVARAGRETSAVAQRRSISPAMIGILVFANWGKPDGEGGFWHTVWTLKWPITAAFSVAFGVVLVKWIGCVGGRSRWSPHPRWRSPSCCRTNRCWRSLSVRWDFRSSPAPATANRANGFPPPGRSRNKFYRCC